MGSVSTKLSTCLTTLAVFAASPFVHADDVVGLTRVGSASLMVGLDSDQPLIPTSLRFVTGLAQNEELVAIDLRPATGDIYGVARNSQSGALQLYQFELANFTAQATAVGTAFTPVIAAGAQKYGFDFNPTIDRIRLVAENDVNYVFHPDTGAVTIATPLFYATGLSPDTNSTPDTNVGKNPNVVNIAYDNNDLDPATATQLRGIDSALDILVTVANSDGRLRTVGNLGVNVTAVGGYDVSSVDTTNAFAIMSVQGLTVQGFFKINQTTGAATVVGIPVFGLLTFSGMTVLDAPTAPAAQ